MFSVFFFYCVLSLWWWGFEICVLYQSICRPLPPPLAWTTPFRNSDFKRTQEIFTYVSSSRTAKNACKLYLPCIVTAFFFGSHWFECRFLFFLNFLTLPIYECVTLLSYSLPPPSPPVLLSPLPRLLAFVVVNMRKRREFHRMQFFASMCNSKSGHSLCPCALLNRRVS
jgi:hypothetical protein